MNSIAYVLLILISIDAIRMEENGMLTTKLNRKRLEKYLRMPKTEIRLVIKIT